MRLVDYLAEVELGKIVLWLSRRDTVFKKVSSATSLALPAILQWLAVMHTGSIFL